MRKIGQQARAALAQLALCDSSMKQRGLLLAAKALRDRRADLLAANRLDLDWMQRQGDSGHNTGALRDRLPVRRSRTTLSRG